MEQSEGMRRALPVSKERKHKSAVNVRSDRSTGSGVLPTIDETPDGHEERIEMSASDRDGMVRLAVVVPSGYVKLIDVPIRSDLLELHQIVADEMGIPLRNLRLLSETMALGRNGGRSRTQKREHH